MISACLGMEMEIEIQDRTTVMPTVRLPSVAAVVMMLEIETAEKGMIVETATSGTDDPMENTIVAIEMVAVLEVQIVAVMVGDHRVEDMIAAKVAVMVAAKTVNVDRTLTSIEANRHRLRAAPTKGRLPWVDHARKKSSCIVRRHVDKH